ncbi:MAG: transcriptional regulator [Moraxellaceae bacterium]|jgi:DNA-binding transcriptional MerR regulator|nr:transcriptional regulator [Moraxellaceae bacterium]
MLEPSNNSLLPEIPSKRYFTIGEVSELCDVKPHVLRYWEQEFPQLKPVKRRGNRRYYQRQDVMIIRTIRSLLYEQGYTIGGARLQLTETRNVEREEPAVQADAPMLSLMDSGEGIFNVVLRDMIQELEQVATLLRR